MNGTAPRQIRVIDSHTGGEPTRVVIAGGPELGGGTMAEQLALFEDRYDAFRSAIVNEPRGHDVLVGALLRESSESDAGILFFNNVGYLGMCGHGLIGVVITMAHLGRIKEPGTIRFETPVGKVHAIWHGGNAVSIVNVPSYRKAANMTLDVPGIGPITGDVAWGGNWFFLVREHGETLALKNVEQLTDLSWRIRQALNAQGFPEVDHIELFAKGEAGGHSRNFVLCPGKAYDRSPCGTGTSAKLACLAADGTLAEGGQWIQESILGSTFRGSYRWIDRAKGIIEPSIHGTAFVTADSTLILDENDPFCWGIR
ncbi:MAG: hydroxyproline-2-epimerase [Chthoniobacteraceae bacterium]|nr:hydroxyproline-2-epimerase [Chthoniobacteraceae bacterium]